MRGSAAFRLSVASGGVLVPLIRDPDARDYIRRVAAADGQPLEPLVQRAIDAFVRGCKADGIWSAIKASCILAGARTLNGALVPLAGTAPTNFNFVSGDYDRKTGLVGDGSTKYLNSNRNNNADPQNNNHNAVYSTVIGAASGTFIASEGQAIPGSNFLAGGQSAVLFSRNRSATGTSQAFNPLPGFLGCSRASSASYTVRGNSSSNTVSVSSSSADSNTIFVYRRNNTGNELYGAHRLAFYSIGEALDLALLDARVTTLINAIGAAIP